MEDEREEELSSLSAIFPELVVDAADPFTATLELPVAPVVPAAVTFQSAAPLPSPPASDDGRTSNESSRTAFKVDIRSQINIDPDNQTLSYFPALRLQIRLPKGYPADAGPHLKLTTFPFWLDQMKILELEEDGTRLWEEYGRCQILYSYIDHLQQSAERFFDLSSPLILPAGLKAILIDYDRTTKKELFDAETFDCGICLEPKKGSSCYRMQRCGHVFCLSCLQDFYNSAITEGDVANIKCLESGCGKANTAGAKKKRKSDKTLHPRELLAIGLEEAAVRRYVDMKRKKQLETDKTTVYCPRSWCQAPARSDKYPALPTDLNEYPDSSDEDVSDNEAGATGAPPEYSKNTPEHKLPKMADRLAVCSKCTYAFCCVCYQGWHGEYTRCFPRNPAELSEEDQASYDYIRTHTSPCPTCSSPTQKTMGCNHMACYQCNTHFCYLCGAWLDPQNPYHHFGKKNTPCYQKLWEGEEGDNADGAINFEGARRWEIIAAEVAEEADREEAERLQAEEDRLAVERGVENVIAQVVMAQDEADFVLFPRGGANRLPEAPVPPHAQLHPQLEAMMDQLQVDGPADAGGRGGRQQRGGRGRGRGGRRGGRLPPQHEQFAAQARQPQRPQLQVVDDAQAAAFRRFMDMAARDEEDDWDSDELDDDEMWEIRAR